MNNIVKTSKYKKFFKQVKYNGLTTRIFTSIIIEW